MAKATIIDITSRRQFLAQAALAGATGAVLSSALTQRAEAKTNPATPDPILEAIEGHRRSMAVENKALQLHCDLDEELPIEKSRSSVSHGEIFETDDPRWIAAEHALHAAWEARDNAAIPLVDVCPTTFAGMLALISYVSEIEELDAALWPRNLLDEDDEGHSFHYFLLANIEQAIGSLRGGSV